MSEVITVRGFAASEVRKHATQGGDEVATFRMGATERRYNRQENMWEDGPTNWFTVACFRALARNVAVSLHKGEKVLVTGRLKIRDWTASDGRTGKNVDIEAETVGHDLRWGISGYQRITKDSPTPWVTVQAPDNGADTAHPGLNRETGEIPEDQDDSDPAGKQETAWDSSTGEESDEEVFDTSPAGEGVRAAGEEVPAA